MVRKVKHMKRRDLSSAGQSSAGVRGAIVAMKPSNFGEAKGSRKMDA